jgi:hypothetical protein
MFSNSKLVSIGLLLAILLISLVFSSYIEGLENASISDAIDVINKDAPKPKISETFEQPVDGIVLGKNKPLSITDITGTLQNNPGVQKIISNKGL